MKWGTVSHLYGLGLAGALILVPSCSSPGTSSSSDRSSAASGYGATALAADGYQFSAAAPSKSAYALYREVNVRQDLIPRGRHARKYQRSMQPKYITIHSTQNFSRGADAMRHSEALKNGKLRARKRRGGNRIGYLVWHYTVDEDRAVQHLPTNEQGEHADFSGPGNRYSIGIEMCENKGNSRSATIERTAKLTAYLMQKHNIPLRKVVPHYHWPRRGLSQPHKNCPHYLLDNGHPGAKWQWFLAKVNKYYRSIGGPGITPAPGGPSINSHGMIVSRPPAAPSPLDPPTISKPVVSNSSAKPSSRYHVVKKGDTLYGLSRRYGTSVSAIQRANGLRGSTIGIGKKLRIPAS
jgi:N-acetylmuramoyl-L-alanine amidase